MSDIKASRRQASPDVQPEEQTQEREEEITESLSEIYQDDEGNIVDVSTIDVKKKRGIFFWIFLILFLALIGAGAYWAYLNYFTRPVTGENVSLEFVTDKNETIAGEAFAFKVRYKNSENVELNDAALTISFPENFILIASDPAADISSSTSNNSWKLGRIIPHSSGEISLSGRLIGKKGDRAMLAAEIDYQPANFSSRFKRTATGNILITDPGFSIAIDAYSSVLINEVNRISLTLNKGENSYLNNLRLVLRVPEGSSIDFPASTSTEKAAARRSELKPNEWIIDSIPEEEITFKIPFIVEESNAGREEIKAEFYYGEKDKDYLVDEKTIAFDVVKSALNLGLIINGSRSDQGIDFGKSMNCSITYANKGDSEMKDIIIMAVIEGGLVDWSSLKDEHSGSIKGDMIIWSKNEIPDLAELLPGGEGTIDFSLNVLSQDGIPSTEKDFEIKSYSQFNIGNRDEANQGENTKSNVIVTKINSDVALIELVRYFNEDNIPVGSGPLPPKVGETTTYKVYWKIANNLHELRDLKIEAVLPPYVSWAEKSTTAVGAIRFNEAEHKVVWDIGKLPVLYNEIGAEFSIGIAPTEEDRNKILVLLPGTTVIGYDTVTESAIEKSNKAKTTKLDDDDIADSDGRVE